jgi:beta-aspartyl-peptidase (threonine type)
VLERGGPALDAIEESVVIMEDDDTFDAGRGSFLNRDGKVQLDALIMDGATLRAGGVGCVERLRNPVRAARKILSESQHVYFVAEGAERFAAAAWRSPMQERRLDNSARGGTPARVSE